jgi:hypothetical protein
MQQFALAPSLDVAALSAMFARNGRLQIVDFLEEGSAKALYGALAGSAAWRLAANRGEQVIDFTPETTANWGPEGWSKLQRAVAMGGRFGFQFLYEVIRLPKPDSAQPAEPVLPLLAAFADFMSSPAVVAFLRAVTGDETIGFADAHASRYSPGHFLSTHDDRIVSQGRRAAYSLNLTPEWRPDWGGLLLFYDTAGNVVRGYTPGFNILNLFAVPQAHSVSYVTPLAGAPRYAVTGWLRTMSK